MSITLYSIGHGNRPLEEFIGLLAEVRLLVDVRAFPGSRRHPHFSKAALNDALEAHCISYAWQGKELGGRRRPRPESRHHALTNASFRAYADQMETAEFSAAIDALIDEGGRTKLAVMCAERLPWQCHRYLISDYLVMRGASVVHLIAPAKSQTHQLNRIARVDQGMVIYDRGSQIGLEI